MEYHQDRFKDYSLMVYKKNELIALLPANIKDGVVYSHQGLSYGSFILSETIDFVSVLEAFYKVLSFLFENKIETLIVKQIPKIYNLKPSDELEYLLLILKANLFRRDISTTIDLDISTKYSKLRRREITKAKSEGLKVEETNDLSLFWNAILIPNLLESHGVAPVHSFDEIQMLKMKFPKNIRQFNVYDGNAILAGCTVFETNTVAHLQYISTNKKIKKGALDFLIDQLITEVYTNKKYLDFGISNENNGLQINSGLLQWKQSFGASPIVHDFYKVEVKNYTLLKTIMI